MTDMTLSDVKLAKGLRLGYTRYASDDLKVNDDDEDIARAIAREAVRLVDDTGLHIRESELTLLDLRTRPLSDTYISERRVHARWDTEGRAWAYVWLSE